MEDFMKQFGFPRKVTLRGEVQAIYALLLASDYRNFRDKVSVEALLGNTITESKALPTHMMIDYINEEHPVIAALLEIDPNLRST